MDLSGNMDASEPVRPSPFFHQSSHTTADSLTILHLKRDTQYPLLLRERDNDNEGYDEGKVVNTRFGSFPHSTLIGVPFGSQVRASEVDTGSRGRRLPGAVVAGQKRKRGLESDTVDGSSPGDGGQSPAPKTAVVAETGFGHILPPTPERWTSSLPHRTQVVYAPDYSYILQRLRAQPGSVIIEAGAGSGSFTHAAARAVFNGYPTPSQKKPPSDGKGCVWTFEFDAERAAKVQTDMKDHLLDSIVTITPRNVYSDGFCLPSDTNSSGVKASIVFLDLPAPWRCLPHLDRDAFPNPLDPHKTIHLCTFSPCIEQVQKTAAVLRARGWTEIEMVELYARRLEVRRERIGLQEEGLRGVNSTPATVDEAVGRLRDLEERMKMFHKAPEADLTSKQERLENIRAALADRKLYKEGRLVHRSEPELKTHTSYLVFAVLPMKWTESDEERVIKAAKGFKGVQPVVKKSKKQLKCEAKSNATVEA